MSLEVNLKKILIIDFGFSVIINLAAFGLLLGCILAVYASKQSSIADNE